ncbi:regulator of sigma E protease [Pustulibacterium marinum]|uniref:Zinc metalloprotease n=1 Tax=Pustulibacterium marinum TaxID=1224947 RepID=A0A1I7I6L6_9FLAO|nr:RIP metalloprotease RseP [Pustulibacterium marinum]SFU68595.1 regulator of sigma E protease [Pustulibacterium marinum]
MSVILVKAIQLILSLSLLIVLHELGHFIPAKLFKTRVEKFFLFFDVKFALFKKKIGETVYGIGWLPLGGYVKISGMIDESMDKEQMALPPQPWEFRSKPAWQRLIIMIGGVTVNVLLGFFIYAMLLFFYGKEELKPSQMPDGFEVAEIMEPYGFKDGDQILSINGEELDNSMDINRYLMVRDVSNIEVEHANGNVETLHLPDTIGIHLFKEGVMIPFIPFRDNTIDTVLAEMPAAISGIEKGDKVIDVDGKKISFFHEISDQLKAGVKSTITVERDGTEKTFTVVPDKDDKLGINSSSYFDVNPATKKYSFGDAIASGVSYGYWTIHDYAVQFKYVFTKKGASQVGGFGAIAKMFPSAWDWQAFWETTALISLILAFMNILPIPALDGGHVVFLLYEMITGRKPSDKFMEYAQMAGFFIVIALVLYANGNDLYRAIFGN